METEPAFTPDNSPEAMEARKQLLQEELEAKVVEHLRCFVTPQVFELPPKKFF